MTLHRQQTSGPTVSFVWLLLLLVGVVVEEEEEMEGYQLLLFWMSWVDRFQSYPAAVPKLLTKERCMGWRLWLQTGEHNANFAGLRRNCFPSNLRQ